MVFHNRIYDNRRRDGRERLEWFDLGGLALIDRIRQQKFGSREGMCIGVSLKQSSEGLFEAQVGYGKTGCLGERSHDRRAVFGAR